jgi:hypothetical protein
VKQVEPLAVASDVRYGDGIMQRRTPSQLRNRVGSNEVRAAGVRFAQQCRRAVGIDDDGAPLIDAERIDGVRIGEKAVVENAGEKDDRSSEAIARDKMRVGDRIGERGPREEPGGEADTRF